MATRLAGEMGALRDQKNPNKRERWANAWRALYVTRRIPTKESVGPMLGARST